MITHLLIGFSLSENLMYPLFFCIIIVNTLKISEFYIFLKKLLTFYIFTLK